MIKSIFKNLLLIAQVYAYLPIRGISKKAEINKIKRVVIMPASKLGDLVCATPIFSAIKKANPDIKITLCINPFYRDLFFNHPDIDDFIDWNENNFYDSCKKIRTKNFDVAIITTPSFIASACFFLAGIKTVVTTKVLNGYCPYQTKSFRLVLPFLTSTEHKMGSYAPREYLKLLEPLGIFSQNTAKVLTFSNADLESIRGKIDLSSKKLKIGIAPGVGNDIKQWDPINFARIINFLHENYDATVYILGTKSDSKSIDEVKSNILKTGETLDVSGLFDLRHIKAFVYQLDLLIAVDTGLIYVAEAFNIPTIDIIGSMDENEQPPIGEKHKLVYIKDRIPEIHIMNARMYNRKEARRHIEEITPEMVYPYIKELLP